MARALGTYGVAAHRVEEAIHDAATALGLRAQSFSTPTSVFVSTEIRDRRETMLARIDPRGTDLAKIVALDEVLAHTITGRITPARGTRIIKRIVRRPARYPEWLHLLAHATTSCAVARFFGGGSRELLAATAIGFIVGCLALIASRHRHAARLVEFIAGIAAAALATAAPLALGPIAKELTMIAGLIGMMPGMALTTGMAELATKNLVSGTARIVGAITVVLSIGVGVAAGHGIAGHLPVTPDVSPAQLPLWTELAAATIAPFGFLILFNARARDAVVLVPAGICSFALARFLTAELGTDFGVCATAAAVGIAGNLYARARNRPASVVILPGILMMVPGSLSFRSFEYFLANDTLTATQTAFRVAVTATSLVAGLLLANVAAAPKRSL